MEDVEVTIKFVSVILSVLASAAGLEKLYATKQKNLTAMINTYLDINKTKGLSRHAGLLEKLLNATKHNLKKQSVFDHINRAKVEKAALPLFNKQVLLTDPDGQLPARIVPEVFDLKMRTFLKEYGALPTWAKSEIVVKL